jgi:cell division protein FtsB
MRKRKREKNFFLRIINSPIFLSFLGLLIVILISFPLAKNLSKKYAISEEIREIQNEIKELESKNKDFKKMIAYLDTDEFVEEQGRLNLGLKKQGEEVVVIKDMDKINDIEKELMEIKNDFKEESNPKKWFRYFLSS